MTRRVPGLARLRQELGQRRFDRATRRILEIAPVRVDASADLTVVSQLCARDLRMGLVALTSFLRFVPAARVVVVDDGTLGPGVEILRHHLPDVEVVARAEIDIGPCPRGTFFERLVTVVEHAASSFVIQLDADTLTQREPAAVLAHVRTGTSFTLGTRLGQSIESMPDFVPAARARLRSTDDHVQLLAEGRFDRLEGWSGLRYVRGCAGFAGFAPGSVGVDDVVRFSAALAALVGPERWSEWGSEQVVSNLLVANTPRAAVLPIDAYATHRGEPEVDEATFVHFIGTHRFARGTYARLARRVVGELRRERS